MIEHRIRVIARVSILLVLIVPAWAGAQDMLKICSNCHGEDGRGVEIDIPIIAGIPALVQEDAIFAYLDGDRQCSSKPLMCKSVSRLTEDQIVEFAAHFSAMPYVAAGEEFDPALAQTGETIHKKNCAICHGEDDPEDGEASILHGQRKAYLRYALQQYAAGERTQEPIMEKKTSALSSDDIEALLNYYASYRN
jgi:sulfide dehydrogenase cytochrome subunit